MTLFRRNLVRVNAGHILALTALMLPTLVVFSSKGAAPLFAAAAVAVVAVHLAADRPLPRPSWLGVVLGAFLVWGLASCFWAIVPLESVQKEGQIAGVFVAGLVLLGAANGLDEAERRRVRHGLVVGALLCAATILVRVAISPAFDKLLLGLVTRTATAHYEAGSNFLFLKAASEVISLLLWPTVIAANGLWGRRGLWGAIAAFVALIIFTQSYTALVATSAGLVTFLLARQLFRMVATILVVGIFLGLTTAPTLIDHVPAPPSAQETPWNVPLSLVHRVHIWRFAAQRIAEKPILGWGLNTSRSVPGGTEEVKLYTRLPDNRIIVNATGEFMPLHPHNAFLQLRLELGLPGVGLAALLLVLCARRLPRTLPDPDDRAAALAALTTALLISLSSFGVFQSWWMGVLWLTATFLASVARPPP